MKIVRSVSGTGVRVLVLQPSMAAQVFLVSAPREMGGRGDFAEELQREAGCVNVADEDMPDFAQRVSRSSFGENYA